MNDEIKDFRKLEGKEKDDSIFQSLVTLSNRQRSIPPDATLDRRIALPYPRTKELKFPLGYEECNGQNGTDDLRESFTDKIIFIQRVR